MTEPGLAASYASTSTSVSERPSDRAAWVALSLLALAMAAGFGAMGSFSTVQESAKAELNLSDYALGLIQGVGAAVPLVLFSIPIGFLVDRYNRVRLLLSLGVIWTVGTLVTALAPGAALLFVGRMLTGIGTTGGLTAALSLGADFCTPVQRGRAMLVVSLGKIAGQAAGFALIGALFGFFLAYGVAGLAPWRSAHIVLAGLSFAALLPAAVFLREPPRQEVASARTGIGIVARELWSRRRLLAPLFLGQVSVVMADAAAGIWAAPVLSRSFGLRPDQFASWMGALMFAAGLGGAILGGVAADWGQGTGRRGGILTGAVVAAAIGVPAALFPIAPGVPLFAVALGVLVLCGTITGLVTSVALTVLIPNELRGFCIGAFIAIAGLIGFGAAPMLVAAASDLMGGERHLGNALALVGAITSALSVMAFAIAMRRAPLDAVGQPI